MPGSQLLENALPAQPAKAVRNSFAQKRLPGKFYPLDSLLLCVPGVWQLKCNVDDSVHVLMDQGCHFMLSSMLDSLFGCSHRRTTFPLTPKRPSNRIGAYVTCLDCGREFPYNWDEMRMEEEPAAVATLPGRPAEGLSRLLRLGG